MYYVCMYVYGSLYQFMGASYMPEKPPNIQVLCTLSGDVMMHMKCFCETPVLNASGIMSIAATHLGFYSKAAAT